LATLVRDEDFFGICGLSPSSFGRGCEHGVAAIAIGRDGYGLCGKLVLVLLLATARARDVSDKRLTLPGRATSTRNRQFLVVGSLNDQMVDNAMRFVDMMKGSIPKTMHRRIIFSVLR
jgi:hypothetical protein